MPVDDGARLTFGYLVPEFPGQTHAFFWRELQRLRELGAEPRIISTSRPVKRIESHPWSRQAVDQTFYLARPSVSAILRAGLVLVRGAFDGRLASAVRGVREEPMARRIQLLIAGAVLAAVSSRDRLEHVHVHSCAQAANIALTASLLSGTPLSYSLSLHGPLDDYGGNQRQKWSHAAFALVITERLRGEVEEQLRGALPGAVDLAPMGVDVTEFTRSTSYRPWDGGGRAIVFSCGRLNVAKGHDNLIRAIGILRDRRLPVSLRIAGEDEQGGTGYHLELDSLVQSLDLGEHVTLLGAVGDAEVRTELARAQVFALASHSEPLGVAIMEAMSMALPVVIGDGGGVRELVESGVSGVLVDPEEPAEIAAEIARILESPAVAEQLGASARARVEAGFDSRRSAEVLLARIKDVLTGRQAEATPR